MRSVPLARLRRLYVEEGRPVPRGLEATLESDVRPGARALLDAVRSRRRSRRAEGQRLRFMLRHETLLWHAGVVRVAGVDEAGMSPLAGPVAAAAVILPVGLRLPEVDDSKKLDAARRERLARVIRERALAYAVAFAEVEEIDRHNIYWAGLLAMRRALAALSPAPEHVLVDGRPLRGLPIPHQAIVHGDGRSLSIAAASILAKTARDALMTQIDRQYPGYGFAVHKGYPVRAHVAALKRLGPSPVHRRSFAPVRATLGLPPILEWPAPDEAAAGLEKALSRETAPR